MTGLSDNQLEMIMSAAEPMAEEKCHEFLKRVAEVLEGRGQISDNDVSIAVQQALRGLISNSAVWKNWNLHSLSTDGQFDVPPAASTTWHLLRVWSKLRKWATQVFATSSRYNQATEVPVDTNKNHLDRKLITKSVGFAQSENSPARPQM